MRHSIEEKLRLLESARELGNITEACRLAGISRSSYYMIKRAFERDGRPGLEAKPRRKPRNAYPDEVIRRILETKARFPNYSSRRVVLRLVRDGLVVSASGIRTVWKRHGLATIFHST